jgi:hypothetical protein
MLQLGKSCESQFNIALGGYADRSSALDLSMSLLPFDWGSRTHRRFLWLQMFNWNTSAPAMPAHPPSGRPQPALTELACVAGPWSPCVAGGETGVLGCLRPAAASDLMQKVLRSWFDWQIAGPKTTNRKVLDPTAADRRCEQQRSIKAGLGH